MNMKNRKPKRALGPLSVFYACLVYIFLYLPIIMVIIYSFNAKESNLVFEGFSLEGYRALFQNPALLDSFWMTIKLALVSTIISVVLGTLATIGLHRYDFKLKKTLNSLLYIPVVIPELVIGVASLATFTILGLEMGFTTLVISHVTFCLPFVIINIRARIAGFDPSIEEAAMDLGATRIRTLFRVTIPMLVPGIISGALISITLSLDDLVISSFVNGRNITFPIKVYNMVRGKVTTDVYALSTLMIIGTVLIYSTAQFFQGRLSKERTASSTVNSNLEI